jgi:hypothetical protein
MEKFSPPEYHGFRQNGSAFVHKITEDAIRDLNEDAISDLPLRLDLRNHSPDGFGWGYMGSGSAQLALALCADVTGDDARALAVYQQFKRRVISRLPRDNPWILTASTILSVIREIEKELHLV